ncbi:MAG: Fis family transcriptional regulator [Gammaproteobacteria bacterium]|nr:Fis family transcriptional regulator [Gammaproteobacteria bacterium]MCP5200588.1 Fis family transcriptional regulator [Gammaproteobacteria bacterium]
MSAAGKHGEQPLCELVRDSLERYFADLNGEDPVNLHELVISQVERPLLEVVLRETRGNISRAAQLLGMNRATLRARLNKYQLKP